MGHSSFVENVKNRIERKVENFNTARLSSIRTQNKCNTEVEGQVNAPFGSHRLSTSAWRGLTEVAEVYRSLLRAAIMAKENREEQSWIVDAPPPLPCASSP